MSAERFDPGTPAPGNAPGHEPPPKGASFMNAVRWILFGGLLLLAVASIAVYVLGHRPEGGGKTAAGAIIYYCPMHPSYTSNRPGECPICGMTLEPMPAEGHAAHAGASGAGSGAGAAGQVPGLAPIQISPERIQLIGVRTAIAARRAMGGRIELVGFVAPDEKSLRRVQIRTSGWIQKLHVNQTGEVVRAGDPLLTIYSPELYQSEQEYLIELGGHAGAMPGMEPAAGAAAPESPGPHESGALEAARERLRLFGVPPEEIARLDRERTASTALTLRSPVTGTVLERNVVEGQSVSADSPLLTIADLSRVWVLADLYEMDFGRVRVGDRAEFRVDALPGRSFDGRVDFVYPTLSSETRTLKIRFALANPGGVLRPGMYGRAMVLAGTKSALAVPAEAVVNAGEHDYVFLARAGGRFEPRGVTIGKGDGEWVPVLSGLAEGDTVVASASFLIDSESRLRSAISGLGASGEPGTSGTPAPHQHGATP
ncbi:MAG TPA: efflux RND transporter periplasmic adaptor subunit [Candidatus Eisenbacteria bacterium]|nr:efflux RND transporter periplasmic adaptor subunit [Candidatus Eisenbacteria bacterium]